MSPDFLFRVMKYSKLIAVMAEQLCKYGKKKKKVKCTF